MICAAIGTIGKAWGTVFAPMPDLWSNERETAALPQNMKYTLWSDTLIATKRRCYPSGNFNAR
jgi:hypothetical protein